MVRADDDTAGASCHQSASYGTRQAGRRAKSSSFRQSLGPQPGGRSARGGPRVAQPPGRRDVSQAMLQLSTHTPRGVLLTVAALAAAAAPTAAYAQSLPLRPPPVRSDDEAW